MGKEQCGRVVRAVQCGCGSPEEENSAWTESRGRLPASGSTEYYLDAGKKGVQGGSVGTYARE